MMSVILCCLKYLRNILEIEIILTYLLTYLLILIPNSILGFAFCTPLQYFPWYFLGLWHRITNFCSYSLLIIFDVRMRNAIIRSFYLLICTYCALQNGIDTRQQ